MPLAIRRLLWSKDVPLVWCIVVPVSLTIGLAWILFCLLKGDRIEVLGTTAVPDHGSLQLGRTSDPEFGHHLWAKSGNFEWVHVGWSLNGGEGSLSAASKSGRFHGIISEGLFSSARNGLHDIPIVIILDAKTGVLWPSKNAQNQPLSVWKKAWSEIKENEPRFPPPPDL